MFRVGLDERGVTRTAGKRLQPGRTGPREKVEKITAGDFALQHREKRLAHPVLRRPDASAPGNAQIKPSEFARGYPHGRYSAQLSAVSQTLTDESPGILALSSR